MYHRYPLLAAIVGIALLSLLSNAPAAPLRIYAAPDEPQTRTLFDAWQAQLQSLPPAQGAEPAVNPDSLEVVLLDARSLVQRVTGEYRRTGHSADLLLVPDSISAAALADAGALMAYPDADTRAFDRRLVDAEHRYFPTRLSTIGIAFHRSARARPTDWQELTKNLDPTTLAWPAPQHSAIAQVLVASLSRFNRVGWRFLRHLAFSGVVPVRDEAVALEELINGQVDYAIVPDHLAVRAQSEGAQIHFANPRSGGPVLSFPIGIGQGTTRQAQARAFIDHVLSEAGQRELARQGFRPAHRRVRPRPAFASASSLKLLVLDEQQALAEQTADQQTFESIFAPR
ncbi:MAG: substrate-binding domain-containing protein [Gammaproteobacteria bacterium]|nr:substrate-binding domain-containing protein [Gammaproteobacteria bacterium]